MKIISDFIPGKDLLFSKTVMIAKYLTPDNETFIINNILLTNYMYGTICKMQVLIKRVGGQYMVQQGHGGSFNRDNLMTC